MYDFIVFNDKKFYDIQKIICHEYEQLTKKVILLGSANLPFENVLKANGTIFDYNAIENFYNNKLSVSQTTHELEELGQKKILQLFNLDENKYGCTVQPYSGTQANQTVYNYLLDKNSHVLAMNEYDGGHISHINYIKKYFNLHTYSISSDSQEINYDEIEILCKKFSPKLLIAGATSYPRQIRYDIIYRICKKYNVCLLADISHTALYVATGSHISPFPYADFVTFTTNKTTRGGRGAILVFKREHKNGLLQSLSSITQGATIFSALLSKNIMLDELASMDILGYQSNILRNTKTIINVLSKQGFEIYTSGSDTHLIMIKNIKKSSMLLKKELYDSGILLNIFDDRQNISSIRIGTLFISSLNYSLKDVEHLAYIIADIVKNGNNYNKEIEEIANKYTKNIFNHTNKGEYPNE